MESLNQLLDALAIPYQQANGSFQVLLKNVHRYFPVYLQFNAEKDIFLMEVPSIVRQHPIKPETALFLFQVNRTALPFQFIYEQSTGEIKLVFMHCCTNETSLQKEFLERILDNVDATLTELYPKLMRVIFGSASPFRHLRTISEIIQAASTTQEGGGE